LFFDCRIGPDACSADAVSFKLQQLLRIFSVWTIRKASPVDAKALSKIAEATFRATFAAANTAEHMTLHCRNNYGERVQAAEISSPDMLTLLAEDQQQLVGYAQLCWGRSPECVLAAKPMEIQRIYVLECWHGKGVAQGLMDACSKEALHLGFDAVWLGVWEQNPRAIAFYAKLGFTEVGDHIFYLGEDPQRDLIMVKSLVAT
jgi:ribosomal protein S18 acetylase RimI-like enzyme